MTSNFSDISLGLFPSFSVDFVVDFREGIFTVELVPHFIIQGVVKHVTELVVCEIRVCIQHLKPANTKYLDSNCLYLFRYRLYKYSTFIYSDQATSLQKLLVLFCARGNPKCLYFTRNTPQLYQLCPR